MEYKPVGVHRCNGEDQPTDNSSMVERSQFIVRDPCSKRGNISSLFFFAYKTMFIIERKGGDYYEYLDDLVYMQSTLDLNIGDCNNAYCY